MSSSAPSTTEVDLDGDLPATEPAPRWTRPGLRFASVAVTVGVLVALYLAYVLHFATNAPQGDDWSVVPLIHSALHGHLTMYGPDGLWAQHLEARILFPNILFVLAGFVDRYDLRSIALFSALLWIASYLLLLRIYRAYEDRPLTVVPCAVLGLIWFSVADTKNILWAFQVSWFIVVCCFMVLLYLFAVSSLQRPIVLVLALLLAVIASYSVTQGFVLWPMGLFLILWRTPWSRRTYGEAGVWVLGCTLTLAVFFQGYNSLLGYALCPRGAVDRCTTGYLLSHPGGAVLFLFQLLGQMFPTGSAAPGAHEILGAVVALGAVYVVVQSFRERRIKVRPPLPAALILFGALFDAMVVYGRFGYGYPALQYVMPQLLLLTGIATYAVPKLQGTLRSPSRTTASLGLQVLCLCALVLLAVEVVGTTTFGISQGQATHSSVVEQARLVVNLSRIHPLARRYCYESAILVDNILSGPAVDKSAEPVFHDARQDRLSLFSPGAYRQFSAEGPPVLPGCDHLQIGAAPGGR